MYHRIIHFIFITEFDMFLFLDDDQPIPLVPLSEDNENAMANKLFKKFLKKVGITPPSTHEVCQQGNLKGGKTCLESQSNRSSPNQPRTH